MGRARALDGTDALVVERISTLDAVTVASPVGGQLPLHATASGKVLLAHTGEDLLLISSDCCRMLIPAVGGSVNLTADPTIMGETSSD
jgi:hypothetical protein